MSDSFVYKLLYTNRVDWLSGDPAGYVNLPLSLLCKAMYSSAVSSSRRQNTTVLGQSLDCRSRSLACQFFQFNVRFDRITNVVYLRRFSILVKSTHAHSFISLLCCSVRAKTLTESGIMLLISAKAT